MKSSGQGENGNSEEKIYIFDPLLGLRVESHQRGWNSGCDPNETEMFETKMLGPNPALAQTPSIFIKSKYEIQRLVVYYL